MIMEKHPMYIELEYRNQESAYVNLLGTKYYKITIQSYFLGKLILASILFFESSI